MERRVVVSAPGACSTSTVHGQSLLVTVVSLHPLSQGSDPSQISAAIHRLFTGTLGLPKETAKCRGGAQSCHTDTTNTLYSPGGHRSNALVLQVQQPGHSSFLMPPRALVGKYK